MILEAVIEFKNYMQKELLFATKELEKIKTEESRKHLQKLVYTNLVDRFDTMVDSAITENFDSEILLEEASKNLEKELTQAEFIKNILNQTSWKDYAAEKVKESLSSTTLRQRHSNKLSKLCKVFMPNEEVWNTQRVNISTGDILKQIKPQSKTIPYSICGYADWLYSRRNAVVHKGGSSKFLDNDIKQIKKQFNTSIGKTVKIQLSSIKTTSKFYLSLINLFEKHSK